MAPGVGEGSIARGGDGGSGTGFVARGGRDVEESSGWKEEEDKENHTHEHKCEEGCMNGAIVYFGVFSAKGNTAWEALDVEMMHAMLEISIYDLVKRLPGAS